VSSMSAPCQSSSIEPNNRISHVLGASAMFADTKLILSMPTEKDVSVSETCNITMTPSICTKKKVSVSNMSRCLDDFEVRDEDYDAPISTDFSCNTPMSLHMATKAALAVQMHGENESSTSDVERDFDDSDRDEDYEPTGSHISNSDTNDSSDESTKKIRKHGVTNSYQDVKQKSKLKRVSKNSSCKTADSFCVMSTASSTTTTETVSENCGQNGLEVDMQSNATVTVARSCETAVFDKKPYCYFCGIPVSASTALVIKAWVRKGGHRN